MAEPIEDRLYSVFVCPWCGWHGEETGYLLADDSGVIAWCPFCGTEMSEELQEEEEE